jgi:hypothetical protein
MRFLVARQLLSEGSHFNKVLLSDVNDVVFQANPFEALDQASGSNRLILSPEHWTWDSTNTSSGWLNAAWLESCVRDNSLLHTLKECAIGQQLRVSCAGVTLGDSVAVIQYLDAFVTEYEASTKTSTSPCNDQGLHNQIFLSTKCGLTDSKHFLEGVDARLDSASLLLTLDGPGSHEFYVENNVAFSSEKHRAFSIVHQIPRCKECSLLGTEHELSTTVLLTMTLFPDPLQIKRGTIEDRQSDYISAIDKWASIAADMGWNLVAVENSGAGDSFENLLRETVGNRTMFEFIPAGSDKTSPCGSKNYGALEAFAIKEAFDKSLFLRQSTYAIKVTGRIFVPNVKEIFEETIQSNGEKLGFVNLYNLTSPPHDSRPYIDTTFIILTRELFRDMFSDCRALPLDEGIPIERTLADFIAAECGKPGAPLNDALLTKCRIGSIGCVRRLGIVGWSNQPYVDDADCK